MQRTILHKEVRKTGKKAKLFEFAAKDKNGQLQRVGRLEMCNASDGQPAKMSFYGDIVSDSWAAWFEEDKCPQDIADFMASLAPNEPLDIYFNSGGGDVFAGIAIYNILKRHAGHKRGLVDGLAASIASVILMACDEIIVHTGAQIMIHKPWSWTAGNADDLRALADMLDTAEESIIDIYMMRTLEGVEREALADMMRRETWMRGADAANTFQVQTQDSEPVAASVSLYYAKYKNVPEDLKIAQDAQEAATPAKDAQGEPKNPQADIQPTEPQAPQNAPQGAEEDTLAQERENITHDLYLYGT